MVNPLNLSVGHETVQESKLGRQLMNTLGVRFDHQSNKFMAWLGESFDGKSQIRLVESWDYLNSIADANHVQRSSITFEDGTIELCEKAWGKPT